MNMKKTLSGLFLFSVLQGQQFHTPLPYSNVDNSSPRVMLQNYDECDYTLRWVQAVYGRNAQCAYDCNNNKSPLSTLFHGSSSFSLSDLFAGSPSSLRINGASPIGERADLANDEILTFNGALSPQYTYNEQGAMLGFDVMRPIADSGRCGVRVRMPVKRIKVKNNTPYDVSLNSATVTDTVVDDSRLRIDSNGNFAVRGDYLTDNNFINFKVARSSTQYDVLGVKSDDTTVLTNPFGNPTTNIAGGSATIGITDVLDGGTPFITTAGAYSAVPLVYISATNLSIGVPIPNVNDGNIVYNDYPLTSPANAENIGALSLGVLTNSSTNDVQINGVSLLTTPVVLSQNSTNFANSSIWATSDDNTQGLWSVWEDNYGFTTGTTYRDFSSIATTNAFYKFTYNSSAAQIVQNRIADFTNQNFPLNFVAAAKTAIPVNSYTSANLPAVQALNPGATFQPSFDPSSVNFIVAPVIFTTTNPFSNTSFGQSGGFNVRNNLNLVATSNGEPGIVSDIDGSLVQGDFTTTAANTNYGAFWFEQDYSDFASYVDPSTYYITTSLQGTTPTVQSVAIGNFLAATSTARQGQLTANAPQIAQNMLSGLLKNGETTSWGCSSQAGIGDLDIEFVAGFDWSILNRILELDVTLGCVFPTASQTKNALNYLAQPLGNNGHFELRAGLAYAYNWCTWIRSSSYLSYSWVLGAQEWLFPSFKGAKAFGLQPGPLVAAEISWGQFVTSTDITFMFDHFGWNIGYQGTWKGHDSISPCLKQATDALGEFNALDFSLMRSLSKREAQKIRSSLSALISDECQVEVGGAGIFYGKNVPIDIDWFASIQFLF